MKNHYILLLFSTLLAATVFAQPAVLWGQRYNGPNDNVDEAHDIAVDNSGNVYVTGAGFAANGTMDMVTIKYSPTGQQLWIDSYNGTANDNDEAFELVLSDSGNVYVVGYSNNTGTMQDLTVLKYNSAGVLQWDFTYNGVANNYDVGTGIAVDANGYVYVIGYVTVPAVFTYDFVTIKINPGGNQVWAQSYDGPGQFNDEGRDIGLDANGDVYVTGPSDTMFNSLPNADMVLLKYSNAGVLQWRRVYDSPGHGFEYSKALAIDRNNNVAVVGYGFISGNGNDIYTIKYNSAGVFQWFHNYNYGPNLFEQPYAIAFDSVGSVIVTGQGIQTNNNNLNDYETVKYNAAGVFQWVKRYDGPAAGDDRAYALDIDDSLGIIVTGKSKGSGTAYDIATVRYDAAGNEKWVVRFDNSGVSGDDAGNAVVAWNGDVYVTGLSSNQLNGDYITLRYTYSAVGIAENTNGIPLLNVYPNPAGGDVRVAVPSDNAGGVYSVTIKNTLGQNVLTTPVTAAESNGNQHVLLVPAAGLSPGVYFVTVCRDGLEAGIARFIVE